MKRLTYILVMVFAIGCGYVRGQKNTTAEQTKEVPVYYKECDGVWNDTCEVFHYWVELNEFDYLFEAPSDKQVEAWKKLCEERNSFQAGNTDGVPYGYLNMNQYVTLWDFYEMWFREDSDTLDVDFTLWRLAQYKDMSLLQDSEYNRFYYLKNAIQGLCLFEGGSQLEMNMKADYANADSLKKIVREIKKNSKQVTDVAYQEDLTERVNNNLQRVSVVLLVLAVLLIIVSYSLISNYVRLDIYSRRFSIHTMKLVGASWAFIRWPFLKRGIGIGLAASLLACTVLGGGIYALYTYQPMSQEIIGIMELGITVLAIFAAGFFIVLFCTFLSVNKFLRMTAGEIYKI